MLMEFKFEDGAHFATNSIKPVRIQQFEEDCFQLFMVKGDLNLDFPLELLFDTFEEAVKWAEAKVGVKVELEEV